MTTIVRFTRGWYPIREAYHSDNSSGIDRSGEYVPLAEYQELNEKLVLLAVESTAAILDYQTRFSELQTLIQRMIKVGDDLFSDPELSPNWHWKDYLMDLDKLVADCKEEVA